VKGSKPATRQRVAKKTATIHNDSGAEPNMVSDAKVCVSVRLSYCSAISVLSSCWTVQGKQCGSVLMDSEFFLLDSTPRKATIRGTNCHL
jgi:hypothetical protein